MPFKLDIKAFHRPFSLKEASELLATNENSMPIAGGTGIYIFSSKGMMSNIDTLVSLGGLDLSYIEKKGSSVVAGGMTKLSSLGGGRTGIQMLDEAIVSIPREVRNAGTVGGQVFTAFPAFDLSVSLLALDASVRLSDGETSQDVPMEKLYSSMFEPEIPKGNIVESVNIPSSKFNRTSYLKFSYTKHGFSDVSMGLSMNIEGSHITDIRLAAGGGSLDSAPVRLKSVEDRIRGSEATEETFEKTSEEIASSKVLGFFGDHRATPEYRKRMLGIMVKRGMHQLAGGEVAHAR